MGKEFQVYQTYVKVLGKNIMLGDIHFFFLINSPLRDNIESILERNLFEVQFFNPWAIATSDKDIVFMFTPYDPIIYKEKEDRLYLCSLEENGFIHCKEIEKDSLKKAFSIVENWGASIEKIFRKVLENFRIYNKNIVYRIPIILGNYEMTFIGVLFQLFYKRVIGDYSKQDDIIRVRQIVGYSQTHYQIKKSIEDSIEYLLEMERDFEELGIS